MTDAKMYYIDRTIAFSETGPDGLIKLTNLFDYYQDVCTFQSDDLGIGWDYLREKGYGWVASSWQVVMNRYPALGERVRIGTAPYEFKGVMGLRNFTLETEDGELLSYANSVWSFIDVDKGTLARVPSEIIDTYEVIKRLDMEYAPRKIAIPSELTACEAIEVKYHNLDINDHVNNAQYISMAEDIVPEGRRAKQIRVEYRASAKFGNIIMPYVHTETDTYTVVLADTEMKPYVIVEFTGTASI